MRKCFERTDGNVKVEPETSRKVSDLYADEALKLMGGETDD